MSLQSAIIEEIYTIPLITAFSIGAGLLEGFRAMQFAETDYMWDCFGVGYLILTVVRMLFLTMQTFILFKYHKVGRYRRPPSGHT